MREELRDPLRLEHILHHIDILIEVDRDIDLSIIEQKDPRFFGIVKLLEIIGEASYKLSNTFKENHPLTPWRQIEKMRHVLVHGYYLINRDDVLQTIKKDIPVLKEQVQEYLKEFDN